MKDVSARERTVRSAFLPGTSEPTESSSPSARAPPSVASSRASCVRQGIGAPFAGARTDDRSAHLVEHVERRRRRGAVRGDAHANARFSKLRERRDPTAEDPVGTRTVRDRDVVLREERDLLLVGLDAMGGDHVRVEQPGLCERADTRRPGRRDEHLRERLPRAACRCGGTPSRRRSRRGASRPEARDRRTRRTARSCRCTARAARSRAARRRRMRSAIRSRIGSNRSRIGSSVAPKTSR